MFEQLSDRPWDDSFLNSIAPRATLERMLRNLLSAAVESNDIERMLRYTEAVLVIKPDSEDDHLNCGRLCYYTQRWQQARSEIEWLMTHDSTVDRTEIEELALAIARDSQK